jgi:hypothetical protein
MVTLNFYKNDLDKGSCLRSIPRVMADFDCGYRFNVPDIRLYPHGGYRVVYEVLENGRTYLKNPNKPLED